MYPNLQNGESPGRGSEPGGDKRKKKKKTGKKMKEKKRKNLHPLRGMIVAKRARRNLVDRSPRCLPS